MPSDTIEIHVATDRPDRRALLARLCGELGRAVGGERQWEGGDVVVPWHASASAFEALPARMVEAILDEWDDAGDQLAGIEFSGYLETDHGPRAWGSLTTRAGTAPAQPLALITCAVARAGDGYRIDARLRAREGVDG